MPRLANGADALHLATLFGLHPAAAVRYAVGARRILRHSSLAPATTRSCSRSRRSLPRVGLGGLQDHADPRSAPWPQPMRHWTSRRTRS
ncbi:hypothetical protein ABIA35_009735 [Catenulispora sp. MAP12-49]